MKKYNANDEVTFYLLISNNRLGSNVAYSHLTNDNMACALATSSLLRRGMEAENGVPL